MMTWVMTCIVCDQPSAKFYRYACETCNTSRLRAAREFIHAGEAIRLMVGFGTRETRPVPRRRPPTGRGRLERAISRLHYASMECVRLKMWPAERSTRKPPWFYGDERSNTR